MIYLDHNATTPVRPEVAEAMQPFIKEEFGNPSSVYAAGQRARAAVERARAQAASFIHADPSEIIFTSGGSEADVLGIAGAAWRAWEDSSGKRNHIIASAIEHDAVRDQLAQLSRRGFEVSYISCDSEGRTRVSEMLAAVNARTCLMVLMHANNETGVLQPVAELAKTAAERGIALHCDAVQAAGKIPLFASALGVDFLALSGHKINAPKGVGALYARHGSRLSAVVTGHQEKNRRGGTENVAGIVGFGKACELAARELEAASAHALKLRRRIEEGVRRIPGAGINGLAAERLPTTTHLSLDGIEGHQLVIALDLEGICVSSGPACSSGAAEASHVLVAMGLSPRLAAGSLRVSTGWGTTQSDVDRFLEILPKAVARLRAAAVAA